MKSPSLLSLAVSAAFLFAGCTTASSTIGVIPATRCGLEAFTICNGIVEATVIPEASGVLTDIRCGSQRFTPELVYTATEIDPLLPPYCSQNPAGGRSEMWTQKIMTQIIPKAQEQPAADTAYAFKMTKNFWKGTMLRMERTIAVRHGESRILVDTNVINTGTAPEKVGLWDNFSGRIGAPKTFDELLFPVKGKVTRVASRGVEPFSEDQIFAKNTVADSRTLDLAPAAPWMARRRNGHTLFVVSIPDGLGKDGFFYTYCGAPDIHTTEPVHETVTLKPGEKTAMHLEYMMFEGMDNLRGLCKDIAVDLKAKGLEMTVTIGAACPTKPAKLFIEGIGESELPGILPGKPVRITMTLPREGAADGTLKASISGYGDFTLFTRK